MKISQRINYLEAFLTFDCPLSCSYCINNANGTAVSAGVSPASAWLKGLDKLELGGMPVTFGGGEPTQHPEFYKILRELNKDVHVDLLTNLQFDVGEFVRETDPARFTPGNFGGLSAYRSIRASFHPEQMDAEDTITKARFLQNNGFNVGLFSLNHPHNLGDNMAMSELARKSKVYFFIKDYLGDYKGTRFGHFKYPEAVGGVRKNVTCRTKDFLIAPDGGIYRCHRDLYNADNPIANLFDDDSVDHDSFRACSHYGECNPCDVKERTNRYLQMGDCNVEIRGVK